MYLILKYTKKIYRLNKVFITPFSLNIVIYGFNLIVKDNYKIPFTQCVDMLKFKLSLNY